MPGHKARPHEKAPLLNADSVIFDWEDAVPSAEKAAARTQTAHSLRTLTPWRAACFIRTHHPDDPAFHDDAIALAPLLKEKLVQAVLLPKIETSASIEHAAIHLHDVALWANIETPHAILHLAEIASHPRIYGLIAGINDLSAALQLPIGSGQWQPRIGLQYALSQMVLMARAHGKHIIDGVYNRIEDLEGLAQECREGRALGFDGKSIIHPSHIEITNIAYSPSPGEIEQATSLVERSGASAVGAIRHGDSMVEELHIQAARKILAQQQAILSRNIIPR